MLIIREQQIAALRDDRDRRLAAALIPEVLEALPALRDALDPSTLERVTHEAIVQGRSFALETDQELGEFVGLVFVCGERFFEREEYAWARALLESSSPTRVREVSERVEQQIARDHRGGR